MLERGYEERTTPTTGPLRLVIVVVVMALAVLGANHAVGRFLDTRGTNLGYVYIAHKWHVLKKLDEPVDWLVLGDSSCSQGFDPAVLQAQTGHTAVNLGTIGNYGLSDDLWMLEEYIERFGPPKRVVLIHVYDVWHRRLKTALVGRIPRPWVLTDDTAERFDFDEEQREDLWLNYYVRLYADRTSLRKTIEWTWLKFIKDEDELVEIRKKDRALPSEDPELLDSGFVRMCGVETRALKRDARGHMRFLRKRRPRLSKDNKKALLAIAELAKEHDFAVDILNGPVYERLRIKPEFGKYFDRQVKMLRRAVKDYPQVRIHEQVRGFDGDELQNVDHITCEATETYTTWAIEQINSEPPPPDPDPSPRTPKKRERIKPKPVEPKPADEPSEQPAKPAAPKKPASPE